ncbi:MAG: Mur ligase domain-containing protein [Puniceicoccales bacterium]|jgi:UDP-N-acetylmuramoyl-tripeptide--D-alanyl-D-alanine ligase|nr:Mur ligase domain-containing protein [Puniceicoccales bacterium]
MNLEILSASKIGHWLNGDHPTNILKFCNDSREITPGDCFIAFETEARDGHDFLANAKANGATCALVSKPKYAVNLPQFVCKDTAVALLEIAKLFRSKFTGTMIAISGSYGKTTTKDILKLLLGVEHNVTFENKNGELGVPMTLASLDNCEKFGIVEVGVDTPGTMDRLVDMVKPNIAIITGIGKIHMDKMENEEMIAREKCKLPHFAIRGGGYGILAAECLQFDDFRRLQKQCICVREGDGVCGYAIDDADRQYLVTVTLTGVNFEFRMPPLMSLGGAKNFALACICAMKCGIGAEFIGKKIIQWKPSKWRGEIISKDNRTYFADCYNANPTALADSLAQFDRLFPHGKRLFVLGTLRSCEMGEEVEKENHAFFSSLPLRENDAVWIVGENAHQFSNMVKCDSVRAFSSAAETMDGVKNFSGVVYIKGHRYYKLENLIF